MGRNKIEDLIALLYDAATVVEEYEPKEEDARKWRVEWLRKVGEEIKKYIKDNKE